VAEYVEKLCPLCRSNWTRRGTDRDGLPLWICSRCDYWWTEDAHDR
jgi:transposase-like protein